MGPFSPEHGAKAICRMKLTKRLLFSFEAGSYLVSNSHEATGAGVYEACYHEHVAPAAGRERQWQRLRAQHQNGKLFTVFDRDPGPSCYTVVSAGGENHSKM